MATNTPLSATAIATQQNKDAFIAALRRCMGIVSTASKEVGVSRVTHYQWLKDDPEYKARVEEIAEEVIDFAESAMYKQIAEGNAKMIEFFMKTRGRKRGYEERQTIEARIGATMSQEEAMAFLFGGGGEVAQLPQNTTEDAEAVVVESRTRGGEQ